MLRRCGASIFEPLANCMVNRRRLLLHAAFTRMNSPLRKLNDVPSSSYQENAPSAPGCTHTVMGASTFSHVYYLTGPMGTTAPARPYTGMVSRSTLRATSRPPSSFSRVQKSYHVPRGIYTVREDADFS